MKAGKHYQNIFSGEKVRVITTFHNEIEYERSEVTIHWTTNPGEITRVNRFIKPAHIFRQTYEPVDNLLTQS